MNKRLREKKRKARVVEMEKVIMGPNYKVPKVIYESKVRGIHGYTGPKRYSLVVKGIGGVIWEFHLSDADPKPSNPHGDGVDQAKKLDVFTGIIYDKKTMQPIGKLKCKEFIELWSNKKFRKLVSRIGKIGRHERIDTFMGEPNHKCFKDIPLK